MIDDLILLATTVASLGFIAFAVLAARARFKNQSTTPEEGTHG